MKIMQKRKFIEVEELALNQGCQTAPTSKSLQSMVVSGPENEHKLNISEAL